MMFEKMSDIPSALEAFYLEDFQVKQAIDDDGSLKFKESETGAEQVPVFVSVPYVVQKVRHDLKTWDEVEQVTIIHGERKAEFIEYCVRKAKEADEWRFHDDYVKWYTEFSLFNVLEPVRMRGESGHKVSDDSQTLNNEAYVDGFSPESKAEILTALKEKEPVIPAYDVKAHMDNLRRQWALEWIDIEVKTINSMIEDMEDEGKDSTELRAYRKSLRDYVDSTDFPNGPKPMQPNFTEVS